MIRVKICGLTRRDDALGAADAGADALGFVFAPGSRRPADPEVVARLAEELPPFVTLVGVFLDQPAEEVIAAARTCRLGLVQLHGSEDEAYVRSLGLRTLKAISLSSRDDLGLLARYPGAGTFLLDSAVRGERGGTGVAFDWSWAVEAKRYGRIVLAGGLHPGNVAEAIRRVAPWAVDVCSGTEVSPGIKDPEKVREFIRRARAAAREEEL
jgi:phosphoribosylanthranilate isomerase